VCTCPNAGAPYQCAGTNDRRARTGPGNICACTGPSDIRARTDGYRQTDDGANRGAHRRAERWQCGKYARD
jgi:hypothetical protein